MNKRKITKECAMLKKFMKLFPVPRLWVAKVLKITPLSVSLMKSGYHNITKERLRTLIINYEIYLKEKLTELKIYIDKHKIV
jgi:hypothetical protein